MRPYQTLSILIALLCFSIFVSAQANLETLYKNHQFFELRDELKTKTDDKSGKILFYRGAIANKFNRPLDSIKILQQFLKTANKQNDAKTMADAYEILMDDYIKTYQYARAVETIKTVLTDFKTVLEPEEIKDYDNVQKLYNSIAKVAPQTILFEGDTQIQATRDKANLLNIPVEINAQKINFVFDTGANISTITVSTAKRMNLTIIESDFDVGSSTKELVKSKLAVAPVMKIGNITVHNAVFLVFEDSALAFPQINYQIEGIIGFPIIEAMRRITITKQNVFTVPRRSEKQAAIQNLCLDGLLPVIQGMYNNRKMAFVFDTGAVTSTLHPPFFEMQKEEITKTYKPQKTKIGGAGGSQEIDSYLLKDVSIDFSGKRAAFPQIRLLTEAANDQMRDFYGNLGQDLIKQFDKMTINFEAMSVVFE